MAGTLVAVAALVAAAAPAAQAEALELDAIKQLAGEWVEIGEDGRPGGRVVSSYRVTAAGSAVLEVIFPGTDHEMTTVYHQDGDALALTHYCVEGNQPRMVAQPQAAANVLEFECIGGGNLKSEADSHMHRGRITFLGPDRIRAEWFKYEAGENTYTAAFELARRK